jgi:hypothetical protein
MQQDKLVIILADISGHTRFRDASVRGLRPEIDS